MTVQDLISAVGTVRFGVTGSFNNGNPTQDWGQCTAIAHKWEQMLGLPIVYGDAFDTYDNAPDSLYDKELNTATNAPRPGAIVVWKPNVKTDGGQFTLGAAAHTAVVMDFSTPTLFQSLDQNYPTGSAPRIVTHTYDGVKGWFYPKVLANQTGGNMANVTVSQEQIDAWLHGPDGIDHWKITADDLNKQIAALNAQIAALKKSAPALDGYTAGDLLEAGFTKILKG